MNFRATRPPYTHSRNYLNKLRLRQPILWIGCPWPHLGGSCSAVKDDLSLAMSLTGEQESLHWLKFS